MEKHLYTFDEWSTEKAEKTFGLTEIDNHSILQEWIHSKEPLTDQEKAWCIRLREILRKNVNGWHQRELRSLFIAPLLSAVDFFEEDFKPFVQREQYYENEQVIVKGSVDFLIAKGKQSPEIPYFCLYESKDDFCDPNIDPLGGLLATLIAIQSKNEKKYPIYGIYIVDRQWFFVILEAKRYSISLAHDATQDDLFQIYSNLKKLKRLIKRDRYQI